LLLSRSSEGVAMKPYDIDKLIAKKQTESGQVFYEVRKIILNPDALSYCVDMMCEFYRDLRLDAVACSSGRGVVFAAPFAYRMHLPLMFLETLHNAFHQENYTLNTPRDQIDSNMKFLIVDDLIASGKTALSAAQCIEGRGSAVGAIFGIIGLKDRGYEENLLSYDVKTLISY